MEGGGHGVVAWFGEEIKEFGVAPFGVGEAHVWGRGGVEVVSRGVFARCRCRCRCGAVLVFPDNPAERNLSSPGLKTKTENKEANPASNKSASQKAVLVLNDV